MEPTIPDLVRRIQNLETRHARLRLISAVGLVCGCALTLAAARSANPRQIDAEEVRATRFVLVQADNVERGAWSTDGDRAVLSLHNGDPSKGLAASLRVSPTFAAWSLGDGLKHNMSAMVQTPEFLAKARALADESSSADKAKDKPPHTPLPLEALTIGPFLGPMVQLTRKEDSAAGIEIMAFAPFSSVNLERTGTGELALSLKHREAGAPRLEAVVSKERASLDVIHEAAGASLAVGSEVPSMELVRMIRNETPPTYSSIRMLVNPDREAGLSIDRYERGSSKGGAMLFVDNQGEPSVSLSSGGRERAVLGHTTLSLRSGSTESRPASSLVLLGPDGKVIEELPR